MKPRLGSLLVIAALSAFGGEVVRVHLPERLVRGNTNVSPQQPIDGASWIWYPSNVQPQGGRFLKFRKAFRSDGKTPLRFHVSADERFALALDGKLVARGPDRGMPDMWFCQSYETTPSSGEHVFEAVVWTVGHHAPLAQLSWKGGFIFKAEGAYDADLTTGRASWRVAELSGTRMTRVKYPASGGGSQCEVSGTSLLNETPPSKAFLKPKVVRANVAATPSFSRRMPGWLLYPSALPEQLSNTIHPGRFRAADDQAFVTNGVYFAVARDWASNAWWSASAATHPGVQDAQRLLTGKGELVIPAHTRIRYLWDLENYYCAYPSLVVSGGRGACVRWGWAEALYVGDCFDWHTVVEGKERKGMGNRADFARKYFYGISDEFHPDGRARGTFESPWWRCGRWCQLEFSTGDEPLTVHALHMDETRYPFEPEASFECDDPSIASVRKLCVRGLQMCMHEMFFDCPYYEQQMYGGDTRVQMLIASSLSRDDRLIRQAFRLLEESQRDNGMISMNYPTTWLQESATYSLLWGCMLGDYAAWHDDVAWVRARMPAVRRMLFGIEAHLNADGLLENLPGWSFMDWVPEWQQGVAPDGKLGQGVSSQNNLLYVYALQRIAAAEEYLGEKELASRWRRRADQVGKAVVARFWDEKRGLVSDTVCHDAYSEHAQCLALLTDVLPPDKAERAFAGLVSAPDLARCTVYFSHYLFEAYLANGRADLFLKRLDLWRDFVKQDLKTPLEAPGDARSDCHAWGAHPLYHLQMGVAGIRPSASGFRNVRVAPSPGPLRWIKARSPTPRGFVEEDLRFSADGGVSGSVTLPDGLTGEFVWHGRMLPLVPGTNPVGVRATE